ncbi:MAG: GNAT family N-acetyltransferase [Bdellovibrionales bacterium]
MFARFAGSVEDKGDHVLVKTPSNPGFHWGNFIIFDRAPRAGDLNKWKALFDREFPYASPHHYTFTWDTEDNQPGEAQEFINDGFELDSAVVLTAGALNPPPHPNSTIKIRKITTDEEWEQAHRLQIATSDPKYFNEYYEDFKRAQMLQYRKMSEAGLGYWFGAYSGVELVGDLGIFCENSIGRYQNVGTHPDFRGQGICGTLVYQAGLQATHEFDLHTLVMEADPEYHAARIYESVGFKRTEVNHALSWWRR